MDMNAPVAYVDATDAAGIQLELIRRARSSTDIAALRFIAVNDTYLLAPYRQAGLWFEKGGVAALSGVIDIERNAPYVQWLDKVCSQLCGKPAGRITHEDLDQTQADKWPEWLPEHGVWIPLAASEGDASVGRGGLVYARDTPWTDAEIHSATEWIDTWRCFHHARAMSLHRRSWAGWLRRISGARVLWAALIISVLCIPVPMTVLAPGELVPVDPIAVRAPLDGVVSEFYVRPNQLVKKGDRLFAFDDVALGSKYDVAFQALATAEAELRQYEQQGLADPKARAQLPSARGNVAERRVELQFLKAQRTRSQVLAPQDGYVLFDDPSAWIGRPVTTGERILRLASPENKEIEAWIGAGDAIPLASGASARLYLSANPLEPVIGSVHYVSHEAARRPDGIYAYRVRASLTETSPHRIGLKGTVRLTGEEVPLAYWMVRRPLATVREFFGI